MLVDGGAELGLAGSVAEEQPESVRVAQLRGRREQRLGTGQPPLSGTSSSRSSGRAFSSTLYADVSAPRGILPRSTRLPARHVLQTPAGSWHVRATTTGCRLFLFYPAG